MGPIAQLCADRLPGANTRGHQDGPNEKQFWRVVNASADTILDLQVLYDGARSRSSWWRWTACRSDRRTAARKEADSSRRHSLPPASRVEFIMAGPSQKVKSAQLLTQAIVTGPDGDNDPLRDAGQHHGPSATESAATPEVTAKDRRHGARGLRVRVAAVTAKRRLYFSETRTANQVFHYRRWADPAVFSPANPPAVDTTQGSVEDWTIQNRAQENHEFHFHQIHFMVLSQDNFRVNGSPPSGLQGQLMDMIEIPYWDGRPPHLPQGEGADGFSRPGHR